MNYVSRIKKSKNLLLCFVLFIIFLAIPSFSQAQFNSNISSNLSVTLFPERPKPNEVVKVAIESYLTDLNKAEISWSINGEPVKKGLGEKNLTLTTGNLGTKSDIVIVIETIEGGIVQKSLSIRPADVDLLWEAESYTPPFYKGKSYFPYQGTVRAVAIPLIINESGRRLQPNEINFTWKKNGRAIGDKSGIGIDTFITEGDIPLKTTGISVEISSQDGLYIAEKSFTISPQKPKVVMYEESPLYGVFYNKALSNRYTLNSEEVSIVGSPYFFTVPNRFSSMLGYDWSINGTPVVNEDSPSSATLRNVGGEGTSFLSLRIRNSDRLFQFADSNISINFGKIDSTFGQ